MRPVSRSSSIDELEQLFSSSSDDSEDSDKSGNFFGEFPSKSRKSRGRPKASRNTTHNYNNNKKSPTSVYRSKSVRSKSTISRRKGRIAPMNVQRQLKTIVDFHDREHDPSGKKCRFVPPELVIPHILETEKYMKPNEKGILTFLPNFEPEQPPNYLFRYFNFKQELEQTDLTQIAHLTDEELDEIEQEIDSEIARIPPQDSIDITLIPGLDTALTNSIGINADVRTFKWKDFGNLVQFDVILMDPPWKVAVKDVTRGVAISYDQLTSETIMDIPLQYIQRDGYIFMWVIAAQLSNGIIMFRKWGYEFVTYLNWIKISKFGKYRPSHGYYMQHNKETLLIGKKGMPRKKCNREFFDSALIAPRNLRQSHKPGYLYQMIENMFPDMLYLEIFARPHNLRNGWVSIGIELPK